VSIDSLGLDSTQNSQQTPKAEKSYLGRQMNQTIGCLGDVGQVVLPLGAGVQALFYRDYRGFFLLALATAVNQVCIEGLKKVTNITRPSGGRGSFPSGHTAAAFLGAGFIACRYGMSQMPWTVFIYALFATFVGASRVATNNHWVSDTVGGCLLALTICVICVPRQMV
jgi:membrane-associated phospholipid phosphatase